MAGATINRMQARANRVLISVKASGFGATVVQYSDVHGNGRHAFWRKLHTANVPASYHQLEQQLESEGFEFTEYRESIDKDHFGGWYVFDRPRSEVSK